MCLYVPILCFNRFLLYIYPTVTCNTNLCCSCFPFLVSGVLLHVKKKTFATFAKEQEVFGLVLLIRLLCQRHALLSSCMIGTLRHAYIRKLLARDSKRFPSTQLVSRLDWQLVCVLIRDVGTGARRYVSIVCEPTNCHASLHPSRWCSQRKKTHSSNGVLLAWNP